MDSVQLLHSKTQHGECLLNNRHLCNIILTLPLGCTVHLETTTCLIGDPLNSIWWAISPHPQAMDLHLANLKCLPLLQKLTKTLTERVTPLVLRWTRIQRLMDLRMLKRFGKSQLSLDNLSRHLDNMDLLTWHLKCPECLMTTTLSPMNCSLSSQNFHLRLNLSLLLLLSRARALPP